MGARKERTGLEKRTIQRPGGLAKGVCLYPRGSPKGKKKRARKIIQMIWSLKKARGGEGQNSKLAKTGKGGRSGIMRRKRGCGMGSKG